MAKREFLMLAKKYNPDKQGIGYWFMSEKLDGQRCFWDGGISRGKKKNHIPWANCAKDDRLKQEQIATGLWSRYGNVIHAPDWWLDNLPKIPLDGELWLDYGDGARQFLMSVIKDHDPSDDWQYVRYYAFDMIPLDEVFAAGVIDVPNFKKEMHQIPIKKYETDLFYAPKVKPYHENYKLMQKNVKENEYLKILDQEQLPDVDAEARLALEEFSSKVLERGGEGVILRSPDSTWTPCRSNGLLKHKPFEDDEGIVTGYITGRKTDKGSKLLGKMGAMILDYNGKRLELSGFTDLEREFNNEDAEKWAMNNPGEEVPDWIEMKHFSRGDKITFRYRGLTRDGIPQEARYWRKRKD